MPAGRARRQGWWLRQALAVKHTSPAGSSGWAARCSRKRFARFFRPFFAARREGQDMQGAVMGILRQGHGGRLFQNDVRIGAADAEGADGGSAQMPLRLPCAECRVDEEWAAGKIDLGVRLAEVEAWRQLPVFQGQNGLDQTGDARRGIEVADVGFDRAEGAELTFFGMGAKGPRQRLHFDGVAELGSRTGASRHSRWSPGRYPPWRWLRI